MLNDDEIRRYARHIVLPEIGGAGQQALKAARVLIIGAGGLGAPVLIYLAAAGVGAMTIVDDDVVDLSNLQRQVIHGTEDIGRQKTASASDSILHINPHVQVREVPARLTAANARQLMSGHDLIIDGSDSFNTRLAIADAAAAENIPLVTGAVGRFDGSVTVLKPFEKDPDGSYHPAWRDLFPDVPPEGLLPSCAEAGILGALTGVIGTLQAMEAIKLITGVGEPLVGRLLLYDSLAARFETIKYKRQSG